MSRTELLPESEWNLVINNLQLQDAGVYVCSTNSKDTENTHRVLLRVSGNDKLFMLLNSCIFPTVLLEIPHVKF